MSPASVGVAPRLTSTAATESVRFGWKLPIKLTSTITRADLAQIMLERLEEEALFGRKVLIEN